MPEIVEIAPGSYIIELAPDVPILDTKGDVAEFTLDEATLRLCQGNYNPKEVTEDGVQD